MDSSREAAFLRYVVNGLYECCGPASDDIMSDIIAQWKADGGYVPQDYRNWDMSLSEDERNGIDPLDAADAKANEYNEDDGQ